MHKKPTLATGTRDFGPKKTNNRKYIFFIIEKIFKKYGFVNIETPAIENMSTLNGKYGNEANKLIFKIINSGNFLSKKKNNNTLNNIIKEGMRYDLTIPFIRYIIINNNKIIFPFKRYQIQNVWRSDKPQKNRYREFHQCDIDIIGSESIICEIEIFLIINDVFNNIGIKNFKININHKKILQGISKYINEIKKQDLIYITMDKIDKIGIIEVLKHFKEKGLSYLSIKKLKNIFKLNENNLEKIIILKKYLKKYKNEIKGLDEINKIINYTNQLKIKSSLIKFNHTLSRGLMYYTDSIFEVKINKKNIGSLGGGGRYNNLTNTFGLFNIPSMGFSFGIDRIYNLMKNMNLFPNNNNNIKIIIININEKFLNFSIHILYKLRKININSELYLNLNKLKKQFIYANKKNIKFVIIIGLKNNKSKYLTLKNMITGKQYKNTFKNIIKIINKI